MEKFIPWSYREESTNQILERKFRGELIKHKGSFWKKRKEKKRKIKAESERKGNIYKNYREASTNQILLTTTKTTTMTRTTIIMNNK